MREDLEEQLYENDQNIFVDRLNNIIKKINIEDPNFDAYTYFYEIYRFYTL